MRKFLSIFVGIMFVTAVGFSADKREKEDLLYGFEDYSDTDTLENFNGELVTEHATEGKQSCKITYTAGQNNAIGVKPDNLPVPDWSKAKEFKFDLFSEFNTPVQLQIKFVAAAGAKTYHGGSEYSVFTYHTIPPKKAYTVKIDLVKLAKDKEGINLDLSQMVRFKINCTQPPADGVIFFDNIRLSK